MTNPGVGTAQVLAGWQAVLAAEHAAIYGYGVVGVHLSDGAQITKARTLQETHRDTRDALMQQIAAAGASPAAPHTLYSPPQPVVDAASAQRWATQLEQACAAGYRYVLTLSAVAAAPSTAAPSSAVSPGAAASSAAELAQIRSQALAGVTAAAIAACDWQALVTPNNPTVPFPGT